MFDIYATVQYLQNRWDSRIAMLPIEQQNEEIQFKKGKYFLLSMYRGIELK